MFGRSTTTRVAAVSVLATVLSALVLLGGSREAGATPTLPKGFVLRDTATGQGPYDLTDFAYLPDGSVITTGKSGRVTWVPTGGEPRTIAELSTDTTGDLGVVGIGVAADYDETGHVYLVRSLPRTTTSYDVRLSRFTVRSTRSTPEELTDEKVLLQISAAAPVHSMTSVVPAPDGTLWVSIGDLTSANSVSSAAFEVRNLDEPAGKILHVTRDGAGVASNPFYNASRPSSWRSRVYASGFRSPFRLSLDPSTGAPIVGDVGWRTWEEIDLVRPGQDYKWPCWEGRSKTPGYNGLRQCADVVNTPPIWRYQHGSASSQGNSVTGGLVYTGKSYPAAYWGAYFFGDYTAGKLWTMRFDPAGKLVSPPQDPPFASDIGGPVKFGSAPNGDIVYADIYSGSLRRLSYSPGNTEPVARAATTTDPETRTVVFDAGESVDYDGEALSYHWDFGDGAEGEGRTYSHTYSGRGEVFEATLTVSDPLGASGTVTVTVVPSNHSPLLSLETPGSTRFAVGEPVTLSATAEDVEDGALQVRWTSAILHCPESTTCHVHPASESTGTTWRGDFTDHPDTSLQVTATVQDSAGVRVSRSYLAQPRERRLTLVSNTSAALRIQAGVVARTAMVAEGATVDVVAAKVAVDGVATFERWADGPDSRRRSVTVGPRDVTLRAEYLTPIGRSYARRPALRALLGASRGAEVVDGRVRYRRYERGRIYWSAAHGVHVTHGRILRGYLDVGGHEGVLGHPVTDVRRTHSARGRYADFSRGSVYWSRATGVHEVHGPIRRHWLELGGELSDLGLPTSGVRKVPGGARSDFEHGDIRWFARTGTIVVRPS